MKRLLLVGWDAADWKVIDPLLARGEMPHLASVIENGVRGNLATIYPPLSPMLWTSLATGKRPPVHGILGFSEPSEDGLSVRPISNLGRKTKALWKIVNQNGECSMSTLRGKRRPDRTDIQKHPLWPALRRALNCDKAIFCVPTGSVRVRISDDTAAANLIGHPQADMERFRNQGMPEPAAGESPIYSQSCE
jgi:predicted AlkP superfamily phosphohydrolase/phosphomutase